MYFKKSLAVGAFVLLYRVCVISAQPFPVEKIAVGKYKLLWRKLFNMVCIVFHCFTTNSLMFFRKFNGYRLHSLLFLLVFSQLLK